MSAALVALLLHAPPLPGPELEARLAAIDAQRAAIDASRNRELGMRLTAGVGYGLFAASGVWCLIELILLSGNRSRGPLEGFYNPPVPPLALGAGAVGFGLFSLTLHMASRMLMQQLDAEEEDLDALERSLRAPTVIDESPPG